MGQKKFHSNSLLYTSIIVVGVVSIKYRHDSYIGEGAYAIV